mmetsp:Transcript_32269/g.63109  ORF Transcript_32269/g.63109 Transcript_32269/m.63109 type:complete len:210 (+) Transcript_32269:1403-2032(+)
MCTRARPSSSLRTPSRGWPQHSGLWGLGRWCWSQSKPPHKTSTAAARSCYSWCYLRTHLRKNFSYFCQELCFPKYTAVFARPARRGCPPTRPLLPSPPTPATTLLTPTQLTSLLQLLLLTTATLLTTQHPLLPPPPLSLLLVGGAVATCLPYSTGCAWLSRSSCGRVRLPCRSTASCSAKTAKKTKSSTKLWNTGWTSSVHRSLFLPTE